ncbi:MAG: hypothetical protein WD077_13360 [Bacteroidia bacterium]
MHQGLENLSPEEYKFIHEVPAWITVLIAGADNVIDQQELEWAERITHFRTMKEDYLLREFYREIDENFHQSLQDKIQELKGIADNAEGRNLWISQKLAKVNELWPKIEYNLATKLYVSFKTLASHIANSSGGVLGFGAMSPSEKLWVDLQMIDNPELTHPDAE